LPAAARKALPSDTNLTLAEAPVFGDDTRFLSKSEREKVEARLVLLGHIDRLILLGGLTVNEAVDQLVAEVLSGTATPEILQFAKIANARRGLLSRRTVFRWRTAAKAGQTALAPRPMPVAEVPAWAEPLMQLYRTPQKPSLAQCVERLHAELGNSAPSYDQARRFMKGLDALTKAKGRMGPRELKSLRWYRKRSVEELRPTAVYCSDGHTADFEVVHPKHGRPFRPEITTIIDVFTRRVVGWSAGLAEATWGTLDAMRHAFTTAGVCDIWYVDRGRGFNNEAFDDEVGGYLARIGVTKTNSLPYNSQARGVIERLHQSLWIREGRLLPTYVGRDMDREAAQKVHKRTRKEVASTGGSSLLMAWQDFLAWAQEAVERYNARPHTALPKIRDHATGRQRHMAPAEAWARAVRDGFEADVIDVSNDDLFRPYERRKVARALVSLFGNEYFAPELEQLHGEEVLVGYDIHDAQTVWVRTLDHRFVCTAKWNGHATAYFPISVRERADELRAKGRKARLERKIEEVEAERDGRLIEFRPAEPAPLPMPPDEIEAAQRELVRIQQPRQSAALATISGQPNFRDDFEGDLQFIGWLMANPGQVTPPRLKQVREILRSAGARPLMQAYGFDIEAAERFLAEQSNTLGNYEEATRHAASVL
jgi:putative transposase